MKETKTSNVVVAESRRISAFDSLLRGAYKLSGAQQRAG